LYSLAFVNPSAFVAAEIFFATIKENLMMMMMTMTTTMMMIGRMYYIKHSTLSISTKPISTLRVFSQGAPSERL